MGFVLLTETKQAAADLSRQIYIDHALATGIPIEPPPADMFAVHENILSAEFGLWVPHKHWPDLPEKYKLGYVHKTPLWIDSVFITGEPFTVMGNTPFGTLLFGHMVPAENRKILEGNFAPALIEEIRNSTRKYTLRVQREAEAFIRGLPDDATLQGKSLTSTDPHFFEEIVAELLVAKGYDVFLTSRTSDNGKDLYVAHVTDDGPVVMMVECKRHQVNSAVTAADVRALVGQFAFDREHGTRASCAMLATTSKRIGTKGLEFTEKMEELSIKTFDSLARWISQYGQEKDGLWFPKTFDKLQ